MCAAAKAGTINFESHSVLSMLSMLSVQQMYNKSSGCNVSFACVGSAMLEGLQAAAKQVQATALL